MPYHVWSIATCCVLKNERLYLKHERRVHFCSLFVLVDFPVGWGPGGGATVMPVSVDTLIEICEVKTIVYIKIRDLGIAIMGLSASHEDYTGRPGSCGITPRHFNLDKQHLCWVIIPNYHPQMSLIIARGAGALAEGLPQARQRGLVWVTQPAKMLKRSK